MRETAAIAVLVAAVLGCGTATPAPGSEADKACRYVRLTARPGVEPLHTGPVRCGGRGVACTLLGVGHPTANPELSCIYSRAVLGTGSLRTMVLTACRAEIADSGWDPESWSEPAENCTLPPSGHP